MGQPLLKPLTKTTTITTTNQPPWDILRCYHFNDDDDNNSNHNNNTTSTSTPLASCYRPDISLSFEPEKIYRDNIIFFSNYSFFFLFRLYFLFFSYARSGFYFLIIEVALVSSRPLFFTTFAKENVSIERLCFPFTLYLFSNLFTLYKKHGKNPSAHAQAGKARGSFI